MLARVTAPVSLGNDNHFAHVAHVHRYGMPVSVAVAGNPDAPVTGDPDAPVPGRSLRPRQGGWVVGGNYPAVAGVIAQLAGTSAPPSSEMRVPILM